MVADWSPTGLQRRHPVGRAAYYRGRGPRGRRRTDRARLRAGSAGYGVGLGVVDEPAHAGRRGRAPVRPHDPAVLPRRLDVRRHCRACYAWPPRTRRCRPRAWSPWCRSLPSWRRTSAVTVARRSPRPRRSPCPGGRSSWSGSGCALYMVDTAAQTWARPFWTMSDAPQSLVALATLPYLVAPGSATGRRHARGEVRAVVVLRTGAVVASLALLVVVTAPTWPVAVSASPCWRRCLVIAPRASRRRPDRRRRPGARRRGDRAVNEFN